jgi:hypothetical protein
MACTVTGLTSNIPYEFRVCAVNSIGKGIWSESSDIIVLKKAGKSLLATTPMPHHQYLHDLETVKRTQDQWGMLENDTDSGLAASMNPVRAETQLSPRVVTGEFDTEVPRYVIR